MVLAIMSIRPADGKALVVPRREGLRRRGPAAIVVPLSDQQRTARRKAADRRTAILAEGLTFRISQARKDQPAEIKMSDERTDWQRWWAGARARWLAFWSIRPEVIRVRAAIARPLLWLRIRWLALRWRVARRLALWRMQWAVYRWQLRHRWRRR